jgi:hypothetical protein
MFSDKPPTKYALRKWRKERQEFFFCLGYSISRWAYVDRGMFDLCCFALGASEKRTAIIFYRSPSIGDHLTLTDALMDAAQLQQQYLEQWKRIAKKIQDHLPFRNDIAHNPVVSAGHTKIAFDKDGGPGRILFSRNWQEVRTEPARLLRPTKGTRNIQVTAEALLDHMVAVDDLEEDMHDLRWSLLGPPRGVNPTTRRPYIPADSGAGPPNPHTSRKPKRPPRSSRA